MIPPSVAVIAVVPVARVEARPARAEIVATEAVADAQVTWLVRLAVEPSVYVPVAVNCSVRPLATDGFTGVTAIDVNAAAVTVRVSLGLVIPPSDGGDRVVPVARVEARPLTEIVATEA